MTDRVFQLGALRVGRTNVGEAMLTIDEDALTLVIRADREEQALRVTHASIDKLQSTPTEITLTLRDGTSIVLDVLPHLFDEIVARCQSVPEVTRTLRSFGSRRGHRTPHANIERASADQRRFFTPFLEARRAAMHARGASAIAAFDAETLARSLEATLRAFAAERHAEPGPGRRALEAELIDLSEPLELALKELARVAADAAAAADDLRLWRAWSSQLRATFEAADRVWIALDAALGALGGVPSGS